MICMKAWGHIYHRFSWPKKSKNWKRSWNHTLINSSKILWERGNSKGKFLHWHHDPSAGFDTYCQYLWLHNSYELCNTFHYIWLVMCNYIPWKDIIKDLGNIPYIPNILVTSGLAGDTHLFQDWTQSSICHTKTTKVYFLTGKRLKPSKMLKEG